LQCLLKQKIFLQITNIRLCSYACYYTQVFRITFLKRSKMKSMYKILTFLSFLLLGAGSGANAQVAIYSVIGTYSYTVPPSVSSVSFDVWGGAGGSGQYSRGGCGGRVQGWLNVTPGQVLSVQVGREGSNGVACCGVILFDYLGGIPDGGTGTNGYAGGGGASSDIRVGPYGLSDRVVVGGAGGGGAQSGNSAPGATIDYDRGGDGGGPVAEPGWINNGPFGGGGGDNVGMTGGAPGAFLVGSTALPGTFPNGGQGDKSVATSSGGGGGGGYYGGGGGSMSGGGGGTSYYDVATTFLVSETPGHNCVGTNTYVSRRGMVEICAPPNPVGTMTGPQVCVGNTVTYTTTSPAGGVWSSSNPAVATVGTAGDVTGNGGGTTILSYVYTIPCGSSTAIMTITVNPTPAIITGGNTICMGNTLTLSDSTLGGTWSSSVPATGTIDPGTGVFTPVALGATTITYTSLLGCVRTTTVTVPLTPPVPIIPPGACIGYPVTISDAVPGGTWTSLVTVVADIDTFTGVLTAYTGGSTIITYTLPSGCFSDTLIPTFREPLPISGSTSAICEGSITLLSELVGFGSWSSSVPTIASASTGGGGTSVITGVSAGIADISYTVPGCPPAIYPMLVNPLPAPIAGSTSLCVGVAGTLFDASAGGSWFSADTTLGVVNISTGVIISGDSASLHLGDSVEITYVLPTGCLTTSYVYVNDPPGPIFGIDSVCQGSSVTLSDGIPGGTWSSTSIATAPVIATTGVVFGLSPGTVTISYNMPNGCYQSLPFRVLTPIPAFVNIVSSGGTDICEGTIDTFIAYPTNAGIPSYTWKRFLTDTAYTDTFIYMPTHGDVIYAQMVVHGVCAVSDTVYDTVAINVWPNVAPIVTISLLGGTDSAHYLGDVITMYSNVTWGGPGPVYQWFKNGSPIPGATNSSYAATIYNNDTFSLQVIGNPPCDPTMVYLGTSGSIILYGDQLGVDPLSKGNALSLFPNPNNGSFVLSGKVGSSSVNDITYEVSNMLGQVVYTGKAIPQNGMVREQITIKGLASGSYLLRANSNNGSEVFHFVIGK
jgi:hypothetical protein